MLIDMPKTYNANQFHSVNHTDPIPELLNRVQALVKAGVSTYTQLAKDIGEKHDTVKGWFSPRRFRPDGAGAVKLHQWAAQKTKRIACTGTTDVETRELHSRYRAEYAKACAQHPVNGKQPTEGAANP